MKKSLFALPATLFTTHTVAHEGHGVNISSTIHYLSTPHLLEWIGMGFSLFVIGYLTSKSRSRR